MKINVTMIVHKLQVLLMPIKINVIKNVHPSQPKHGIIVKKKLVLNHVLTIQNLLKPNKHVMTSVKIVKTLFYFKIHIKHVVKVVQMVKKYYKINV